MNYNKLWHTVNVPVTMLRKDIDFEKTYSSTWNYGSTGYKTMTFHTPDLISTEFIEWFYHLGLPLVPIQMMFATAPGYRGYLHKDTHPETLWNGKYCQATLNYHMTDTPGHLVWYDCPEAGVDWITEAHTPAERYSVGNRKELDRWSGPKPALCRVDCAHLADNLLGKQPRIVISIRFMPNPNWEEVVRRLSPWIEND